MSGEQNKSVELPEQLEELGELFVDAESLDEILGWAKEKRLAKAQ